MTTLELVQKYYLGLITLGDFVNIARDHNINSAEIDEAGASLYDLRFEKWAIDDDYLP